MNLFAFTGNLGADAEVKYTPSGVAICEMRVAVRAGYGERQKTLWVRASLWGKRAEGGIVPYLVKGQTVAISGELSTSEWENKDGVKQTTLEVKVNEVDLIGKRDDSVQEAKPKQEPEKKPDFDDDVPW